MSAEKKMTSLLSHFTALCFSLSCVSIFTSRLCYLLHISPRTLLWPLHKVSVPDGFNLLEDSRIKMKGICSGNSFILNYFLLNIEKVPHVLCLPCLQQAACCTSLLKAMPLHITLVSTYSGL